MIAWNLLSYHFLHPFLAWASVYALMFQCIGLYALMSHVQKRQPLLMLALGLCAALAILSKQNVGVYLCVASCMALVWNALSVASFRSLFLDLALMAAGGAVVFFIFVLWLWKNGAVYAWWMDNIEWPQRWAAEFGEKFDPVVMFDRLTAFRLLGRADPFNPIYSRPDILFVVLPAVTVGVFAWCIWQEFRRDGRPLIVALTFVSLASWLQMYPVPGIGHVWWSTAPMVGLAFWAVRGLAGRRTVIVWLVLALLFAPPAVRRMYYLITDRLLSGSGVTLITDRGPLRGIVGTDALARYISEVQDAIRTNIGSRNDVVMDGPNGLYLTFIDNPVFVHPLWAVPTPAIIPIAFPDFDRVYGTFVHSNHPFVISDEEHATAFMSKHPTYKVVATVKGPRILRLEPETFVLLH